MGFSTEYKRRKNAGASVLSLLTSSKKDDDEEDTYTLSWFSSSNMNQRHSKRKQMIDTMKAVKEFESATKTRCPEMLAQLLERNSQLAVQEGNRAGIERAATTLAAATLTDATSRAVVAALSSPANCVKKLSS